MAKVGTDLQAYSVKNEILQTDF